MDPAVTAPGISIAASGEVTALGLGRERLEQAVRANAGGLRECPRLAGKGYQSTVGGYVPDEVWRSLRERDPAHADAPAFLLADAALREARAICWAAVAKPRRVLPNARTGRRESSLFDSVPASRRGLVLSTTKAEITALESAIRRQPCSATARRHLSGASGGGLGGGA